MNNTENYIEHRLALEDIIVKVNTNSIKLDKDLVDTLSSYTTNDLNYKIYKNNSTSIELLKFLCVFISLKEKKLKNKMLTIYLSTSGGYQIQQIVDIDKIKEYVPGDILEYVCNHSDILFLNDKSNERIIPIIFVHKINNNYLNFIYNTHLVEKKINKMSNNSFYLMACDMLTLLSYNINETSLTLIKDKFIELINLPRLNSLRDHHVLSILKLPNITKIDSEKIKVIFYRGAINFRQSGYILNNFGIDYIIKNQENIIGNILTPMSLLTIIINSRFPKENIPIVLEGLNDKFFSLMTASDVRSYIYNSIPTELYIKKLKNRTLYTILNQYPKYKLHFYN